MENAKRDENHVPAALAEGLGTGETVALKAETATGRLLVEITTDSGAAAVTVGQNAKRDQNFVAALLAEADDGSGNLIPLAADADGNLLCDILYE